MLWPPNQRTSMTLCKTSADASTLPALQLFNFNLILFPTWKLYVLKVPPLLTNESQTLLIRQLHVEPRLAPLMLMQSFSQTDKASTWSHLPTPPPNLFQTPPSTFPYLQLMTHHAQKLNTHTEPKHTCTI